jgi:hypothetical protein
MIVVIWPVSTDPCDHRMEAAGHDPGVELRHVTNLRYGACTGPVCARPAKQCDFEHNIPYHKGGKTCLCNGNPECRHDHGIKQRSDWKVEHMADGSIVWTAPTGRQAVTEPYRYPI